MFPVIPNCGNLICNFFDFHVIMKYVVVITRNIVPRNQFMQLNMLKAMQVHKVLYAVSVVPMNGYE